MGPVRWLEQYTLRSQAIQNAYADYNGDVAAGTLACPAMVAPPMPANAPLCPFNPIVSTSAFASRTFEGVPPDPTQVRLQCEHMLRAPCASCELTVGEAETDS